MDEFKVHEEQRNNCTITIGIEPEPDIIESPREDDNLGTIVYGHREYQLGEVKVQNADEAWEHMFEQVRDDISDQEYRSIVEEAVRGRYLREDFKKDYGPGDYKDFVEDNIAEIIEDGNRAFSEVVGQHLYVLPVFLFDHSGITISTGAFSCPWDSGQVGYIYATKRKVEEEKILWYGNDPYEILRNEIREFDNYIRGEVYHFTVEENGTRNEIDSCTGFMGESGYETALQIAREAADRKPQMELGLAQ